MAEILSPNYILPDNDVWLLKGVPLEDNYEDTVIWQVGVGVDGNTIIGESVAQAKERQFNYFTATVGQDTRYHHLRLPAMTYLREGRKYLRVDLPYTRAIQYNYLIFKNNGQYTIGESTTAYHYENRYYYAFIKKFEYINDRTTLIHYEIDLMQTYNFDYELQQCFIDREHTSNDTKFTNYLPENITASEYTYSGYGLHPAFLTNKYRVIIAATVSGTRDPTTGTWSFTNAEGGTWGGIYSGLYYNVMADMYLASTFLRDITNAGKEDSVISVFEMPVDFIGTQNGTIFDTEINWDLPVNSIYTDSWTYTCTVNGVTKQGPRNNKLYSYPFSSIIISNGNGEIGEYAMQYFDTTHLDGVSSYRFSIYGQCSPNPEFSCRPNKYKGIGDNILEQITVTNMPQCAYSIDAYRAWLAQNKVRIQGSLLNAGAGIASGILGTVATGNPLTLISGLRSALSSVTDIVDDKYRASILGPQAQGKQTPSLSVATGDIGFSMFLKRPTDIYCAIIDDFFDLYGYSCHEVKVPNRTVRPYWCYTKTVGCRLTSINRGIPADVDNAIREIYNNGIRFWKNPANIGNYALNNQI